LLKSRKTRRRGKSDIAIAIEMEKKRGPGGLPPRTSVGEGGGFHQHLIPRGVRGKKKGGGFAYVGGGRKSAKQLVKGKKKKKGPDRNQPGGRKKKKKELCLPRARRTTEKENV